MARFVIETLKAELDARGWTQQDAAARAGVSENTFSLAAQGKNVSPKTFYKIGLTLKLNPPLDNAARLLERPVEVAS